MLSAIEQEAERCEHINAEASFQASAGFEKRSGTLDLGDKDRGLWLITLCCGRCRPAFYDQIEIARASRRGRCVVAVAD